MTDEAISYGVASEDELPTVREFITALTYDEQAHYAHPRETYQEIAERIPVPPASFTGSNVQFVARNDEGEVVGCCWCVIFDPGTGLEAEIAELYVREDARKRGIGTSLVRMAVEYFRVTGVMFAHVWTRDGNDPARQAYVRSGFAPTEQLVLTWLPLPAEEADRS